ncbi:hypothetical protein [Mycobacterium sp. URHB0021]
MSGAGQNAGTSHLKLVFAPVGPTPQVGSAAAAPAKGTEILALPEAFANQVIAQGPNAVPDTVVAAGRQAADKFISDANQAASELVALATSPTLLDVLQLPINTAWQIGAGLNLPKSPLVPTPFTSLLTVSNSALQVALLPLTIANLAIYGHIQDIPATVMNTLNTAGTSLFQGLPASVNGIVQYDFGVLQQFATGLGAATVNAASSSSTVSAALVTPTAAATAAAAAAAPTLLDVLQLPINTAWQIGAGLNLPNSPLIPKPYTSVLKATGDLVQAAILPLTALNLAIYGQIQSIPATVMNTLNTAGTSLFQGLPASIMGTLQYDATLLQQFFNPDAATAAAVNTVAKDASLAVSPAAAAAAPAPTPLDVLQLPINTAWSILAGVNVPTSPLVPKPFTSLLTVAGNVVQVGLLPLTALNLAIYGQIQNIPATVMNTLNTAGTSIFQGLPASIAGILNYDASLAQRFFNPTPAPAANANVTNALAKSTIDSKKPATEGVSKSDETTGVDDGKKDATGEKPSTGTSPDGSTTEPSGTAPSGTHGSTGGTTGSTGTTGSASGSTGKDGSTGSGTAGTHSGTTGGSTGTSGNTGNGTTGKGGSTGSGGSTGHHAKSGDHGPRSNGGNGGASNGGGTGASHAKGEGSHAGQSHKSAK